MLRSILEWLASWFGGHSKYDLYKPSERLIYRYFNGRSIVSVDPMVMYRRLMDKAPDLSCDIRVANSPSKDATVAHGAMLAKIRDVFLLPDTNPFDVDAGGLTEIEALGLLDHFMDWTEHVKKKSNPYVTSRTATSPTSAASSDAGQPTKNTSDCGSAGTECSTAAPTP